MSVPLIPGYAIGRTLGKGGMATVYLAVQEKFEREVALKVMAPALSADAGFRERFLREAKIVAKISHPNIVAVYDVNEVDGVHYIAMEYHPGGDLKSRLRDGVSPADALRITRDVARALDYAHSKGYLHRDIKPDNILFRADGSAVLTDFGIAKATEGDANLTQMGMVAGTPKYMSPEQARGQVLDADSDLYSLGVVLFEMLAGRLPYEAPDPIALGILHMNAPIPALEGRLAHFQPLIDRLLAKNAAQRPQSGTELIAEIDRLEKGYDFSQAAAQAGDGATLMRPAARRPAVSTAPADAATVLAPSAAPPARRSMLVPAFVVLALAGAAGGAWWSLQGRTMPPPPAVAAAVVDPLERELAAAQAALARNALTAPAEDNALMHFRRVLATAPGDGRALAGMQQLAGALLTQAREALSAQRYGDAGQLLAQVADVAPQAPGLAEARQSLEVARNAAQQQTVANVRRELRHESAASAPDSLERLRIGGMLGGARQALSDGDTATAIERYRQVLKLDPQNREAREGLRQAQAR